MHINLPREYKKLSTDGWIAFNLDDGFWCTYVIFSRSSSSIIYNHTSYNSETILHFLSTEKECLKLVTGRTGR